MCQTKQTTISMDVARHVWKFKAGTVVIHQDREINVMKYAEIREESELKFAKSMIHRALFALTVKAFDLDVLALEGAIQLKTPVSVAETGLKIQEKYVTSLLRQIPQFQAA